MWDNYLYFVQELPVATWFLNSVLVALAVTRRILFVDALAAFAFASKPFWGRDFLFGPSIVAVNSVSSGVS